MLKKAGLLRSTSVTLFAVFSVLLLTSSQFTPGNYRIFGHKLTYLKSLSGRSAFSDISLKKPFLSNDHIRVRYMGGDCGYDQSSFLINFATSAFSHALFCPDHNSFVFSRVHLLFKLRGPPPGNILA